MSKRKSRGSRETSKLLEQMGLADDDEAPAEPQVLPEAAVLPKTSITSNSVASPSRTKPPSRAALWALVIALVAVAGGVAALYFVFRVHP